MEQINWLQMLANQQTLHLFFRQTLHRSADCTLNASELELLSLLYLHPEANTPLALSRESGMKKEAISRCLKQLFQKDCLTKAVNPLDERSYALSLTPTGLSSLEANYKLLLRPIYELQRRMGSDFDTLFLLLEKASRILEEPDSSLSKGNPDP